MTDGTWAVWIESATAKSLTFAAVSTQQYPNCPGGCTENGMGLYPAQTLQFASPNIRTVLPMGRPYESKQGVTAPAWVFSKIFSHEADPATADFGPTYQIPSSLKSQINVFYSQIDEGFAQITVKNGLITDID